MSTGQTVGTGAATGAASGTAMGAMAGGPWGALAGGVIGGAMGALGGMGQAKADKAQKAAIEAQQRAIQEEQTRRAQGVGATRAKFGDVGAWGQKFNGGSGFAAAQDPSKFQDIGKTLEARSQISGGVEQMAGATRDIAKAGLTDAAQQGSAGMRAQIASRGLQGSSLERTAKEGLLAGYTQGRGEVASATQGARDTAWGNVMAQQNAFESAAGQGGNIQGQLSTLSNAGNIAGARGQIPVAAMGNLLNMGIGMTREASLAQAQGGQGWGAMLPGLNSKDTGVVKGKGI